MNFLIDDQYEKDKNSVSMIVHHANQTSRDTNYHDSSIIFMLWLIISSMKELFSIEEKVNRQNYVTELLFDTPVRKILQKAGKSEVEIFNEINLLSIFLNNYDQMIEIFGYEENDNSVKAKKDDLISLLDNEIVRTYLCVNQFENVWYYNKENFEELLNWVFTFYDLEIIKEGKVESIKKLFNRSYKKYLEIIELSKRSEFKFEKLKENMSGEKTIN